MAFKDYFKEFQNLEVNDLYCLRQADPDKDLDAFCEIYTDSEIWKYYGCDGCKDKSKVKVTLNNTVKAFTKGNAYTWMIADKKTDKAIGRIHLSEFEFNNKIANIGYLLSRSYWGKGVISACISPVVNFGFDYLHLERIYTRVATENIGSWKALEKNGFTREGLLRHSFKQKDGLCDCYIYSILSTGL